MGIEKIFSSVNTALDWVDELSGQFLEESIIESRKTLEQVSKLLSSIGVTGKFDKTFNDIDHIWSYALILATVLNGQNSKDIKNFEVLECYFKKYEDWIMRRAIIYENVIK